MTELDRYDHAISWLMAIVAVGALILGAPLWAIVLICATCCTVVLYRHLPLPPRRR
ncbi:MAG TPA: hypothetical protein VNY27_10375 [Solirubrobacteraceae bacterium]|jgi:hypothetical protein|nr:hypothetical protein [Solirubrobacteraceae bacterium]